VTSPPSTTSVPATANPSITIVKTATPANVSRVGDVISYSFLVTNTGNVTLSNIRVTDTQAAPAGPPTSGPTCPQPALAPGTSETCTGTYTVTQADVNNGKVNDTAVASGLPPGSTTPVTSPPAPASVGVTPAAAQTGPVPVATMSPITNSTIPVTG
jgi:uncharacterized repeat protein (TIGR01451 family)